MENIFSNSLLVESDSFGRLHIPAQKVSDLISTSRPEKMNAAFILKEFESAQLQFILADTSNKRTDIAETVTVECGLQSGAELQILNFFFC